MLHLVDLLKNRLWQIQFVLRHPSTSRPSACYSHQYMQTPQSNTLLPEKLTCCWCRNIISTQRGYSRPVVEARTSVTIQQFASWEKFLGFWLFRYHQKLKLCRTVPTPKARKKKGMNNEAYNHAWMMRVRVTSELRKRRTAMTTKNRGNLKTP